MLALACWLALGGGWLNSPPVPASRPPVVLKFKELVDKLRGRKGEVVVVDFWSDGCLSCKRDFPQLVKMHGKLKSRGLVCMSVNLDEPADAKLMTAVKNFLAEQRADFDHFILDEESPVWQKLIGVAGPPVVFVFGRDGKLARKFDGSDDPNGEVNYQLIEELVVKLLEQPRPQ